MQKKLTISIDEAVYRNLYSVIGEGKISKFIENIIKPYLINEQLKASYEEMAQDKKREKKANEWIEGLIQDDFNEKR
ncbi:MAG: addiction module antitoxin [Janthinobacterium lividum]